MDQFTLGTVGQFSRPRNTRLQSEDIRRVHGVPQIQAERKQQINLISVGGNTVFRTFTNESTDIISTEFKRINYNLDNYLKVIK